MNDNDTRKLALALTRAINHINPTAQITVAQMARALRAADVDDMMPPPRLPIGAPEHTTPT